MIRNVEEAVQVIKEDKDWNSKAANEQECSPCWFFLKEVVDCHLAGKDCSHILKQSQVCCVAFEEENCPAQLKELP